MQRDLPAIPEQQLTTMHVVRAAARDSVDLSDIDGFRPSSNEESDSLLPDASGSVRGQLNADGEPDASTSDHVAWYKLPSEECFRYGDDCFANASHKYIIESANPARLALMQARASGSAFVSPGYSQLQLHPCQHGFHWPHRKT